MQPCLLGSHYQCCTEDTTVRTCLQLICPCPSPMLLMREANYLLERWHLQGNGTPLMGALHSCCAAGEAPCAGIAALSC